MSSFMLRTIPPVCEIGPEEAMKIHGFLPERTPGEIQPFVEIRPRGAAWRFR